MQGRQKDKEEKTTSEVLIEKMKNLVEKSQTSDDVDELLEILYKQHDVIALAIAALENSKITTEMLNQLDDLSKIVVENAVGTIKEKISK